MNGAVIFYCDGLCEPSNPGGYGCWGWLAQYHGRTFKRRCGTLGRAPDMTNNRAEYAAVLDAMRDAVSILPRIRAAGLRVVFRTDSQLIANQIAGVYACRSPHLQPLCRDAQALLTQLDAAIEWIPREQNTDADALSRVAYEHATQQRSAA